MQRKPGFPTTNCNIKMPDCVPLSETFHPDDEGDQLDRRQQLINFGHSQWGFNNWSWSVSKQELDFVDFSNAKYNVGVVAYVSVTLKNLNIHRENIGYASTVAAQKGLAIYQARKCAVTNALRETLLSFGGSVATDLLETTKETRQSDVHENNQNLTNKVPKVAPVPEPMNVRSPMRKDSVDTCTRPPQPGPPVQPLNPVHPVPPVRPPVPRHNPNVSFVVSPLMPGVYGAPRVPAGPPAPPPVFPHYYEYPWHFYDGYDRHHGNVNVNFNIPPKNVVVNGHNRGPEECNMLQNQGCWIKPTIFYDGFWTEQKVKKWVAEQVEKQFPEVSPHPTEHKEVALPSLDDMSEEEARAERRRRQRLAQEEFRLKQLGKQGTH